MELQYADASDTTIRVTLDDGERLGHLDGPVIAFVPTTDPANAEYADIVAKGYPVTPFGTAQLKQ